MEQKNAIGTLPAAGWMKQAALVFLGVAGITICAKIQVPFWPVPMTLQTLALFAVPTFMGLRLGVAAIVAYLALGFFGVPVFSGAAAGPAYFMGPTAGFLIGFVALVALVGAARDRGLLDHPIGKFFVYLGADAVCFALGFAWLAYGFILPSTGNAMGASAAFAAGVLPFILADVIKAALAAAGTSVFKKRSSR